ncbi:MAG: outer membrane beta-barrel protein [Bacteroidales bacterium]|nr:outer membrane beta-barrel protein [Bacteroidales bacterium]
MKTKIVFLLFFVSLTVVGQNTRNSIGLSIGPSFPLGDFSHAEIADSTSGWAKTGFAIQISYAYRIAHNFGITALGLYSGNKFNASKYKEELEILHPDYGVSIETRRNWSSGGMLLGPYLHFPLSDAISWDIRALFGFYGGYSPQFIIRATQKVTGEKAEYIRQSGKDFSFGYSVGTGFTFELSNYYILIFADYLGSPVQFDNVIGWDWVGEPYTTSFKQEISYVSLTFGIGFVL